MALQLSFNPRPHIQKFSSSSNCRGKNDASPGLGPDSYVMPSWSTSYVGQFISTVARIFIIVFALLPRTTDNPGSAAQLPRQVTLK